MLGLVAGDFARRVPLHDVLASRFLDDYAHLAL